MKVFTRDYRITGAYHELWDMYFGGLEPCVLDIETTGLSPARCRVVLAGLLMRSDKGVTVTQFLARNHYEESKVLDAVMEYIEERGAGCLVTYNGQAFDVPFINKRLEALYGSSQLYAEGGQAFEVPRLGLCHFDLYRFLCRCTDLKERAGSMSQKAIEEHYGILTDRGDTITGRQNAALFDQYALSADSTIEKIILTHNREDVLQLHRLMYLALGDIPAQDMHSSLARYGFPAADGRLIVRPRLQRHRGRAARLIITGEQLREPVSCAYYPDADCPVTAVFNASSRSLEIEVPVSSRGSDCYMDISFLTGSGALRSDPDCINDYLILGPRTVNLVSGQLAEHFLCRQ